MKLRRPADVPLPDHFSSLLLSPPPSGSIVVHPWLENQLSARSQLLPRAWSGDIKRMPTRAMMSGATRSLVFLPRLSGAS